MDNTDWAYLAGVIDGDGCIAAWAPKKRGSGNGITLKVSLTMRTPEAPMWAFKSTGVGKLYTQYKATQNNAVYYIWDVFARNDTAYIVEGILPYLKTKKSQAELFLVLRRLVSKKGPRTEEAMQKKLELVGKIRELKKVS